MTIECPCHSGKAYAECCEPSHQGRPAPTPEALMRSRYAAYALVIPDYIITTTHPANPLYRHDARAWSEEIRQFGTETHFDGLEIRDVEEGENLSSVTFYARLSRDGQNLSFTERSTFEKVGKRWLYRSGEVSS